MGVGADDGGDPAVKIPGQAELFAGGLGVEIHQHHPWGQLGEDAVQGGKGLLPGAVHVDGAAEVHNGNGGQAGLIVGVPAPARSLRVEVGGADDGLLLGQVIEDLPAAQGVVSQGDDACPGAENFGGGGGEDAVALGGVFPVDDGQLRLPHPPQDGELLGQEGGAPPAHHVPNEQDAHGAVPLPKRYMVYYTPFPGGKKGRRC